MSTRLAQPVQVMARHACGHELRYEAPAAATERVVRWAGNIPCPECARAERVGRCG